MKKLILGIFLLGNLAQAAENVNVSYQCQNGRNVDVNFKFDDDGKPTSASFVHQKKKQVLNYDASFSDEFSANFANYVGYRLMAGNLSAYEFLNSSVLITAPNNELVFKNCSAKKGFGKKEGDKNKKSAKQENKSKEISLNYICQNNAKVNVKYKFNEFGIPTQAKLKINGKERVLPYDLNSSDDVESNFKSGGYYLSSSAITIKNYRTQEGIIVTANDKIIYKNCSIK